MGRGVTTQLPFAPAVRR